MSRNSTSWAGDARRGSVVGGMNTHSPDRRIPGFRVRLSFDIVVRARSSCSLMFYGVMSLFLIACATKPATTVNEQCNTVESWVRLTAPPPEADQLLGLTGKDLSGLPKSSLHSPKPAWFRSEEGLIRYCRYSLSSDPCDGPWYVDFQQVNGVWTKQGGGFTSICIDARKRA